MHLADWLAIGILVATVIGIFAAAYLGGFFDNRHRKRKACSAIIRELEDTGEALASNEYEATERKDEGVYYKNAFLTREAYESILHSGVFTEFLPTTQIALSKFYGSLKLRNELMIRIANYNEIFFLNNTSLERDVEWRRMVLPYQQTVTQYESILNNLLVTLIELLKDERPKSSLDVLTLGYFGRIKGRIKDTSKITNVVEYIFDHDTYKERKRLKKLDSKTKER